MLQYSSLLTLRLSSDLRLSSCSLGKLFLRALLMVRIFLYKLYLLSHSRVESWNSNPMHYLNPQVLRCCYPLVLFSCHIPDGLIYKPSIPLCSQWIPRSGPTGFLSSRLLFSCPTSKLH